MHSIHVYLLIRLYGNRLPFGVASTKAMFQRARQITLLFCLHSFSTRVKPHNKRWAVSHINDTNHENPDLASLETHMIAYGQCIATQSHTYMHCYFLLGVIVWVLLWRCLFLFEICCNTFPYPASLIMVNYYSYMMKFSSSVHLVA